MSEKRRKVTTILLRNQGKKTIKLELFPASQWGGPAGAYRLRRDGRWTSERRHSTLPDYRYHTTTGLIGVLYGLLTGQDMPYDPPDPPYRRGDRVSVPTGRTGPDGEPVYAGTFLAGAPILAIDGRWWAPVVGRDEPVALDTLRGRS
jgi:hypothetical protein